MKDALGNELRVGDMVAIQLARPLVFGQIVEAGDGGLITAVGRQLAEIHPGRLVVMCRHVIEFDPRQQIEAVMALRNDVGNKAVEESGKPN